LEAQRGTRLSGRSERLSGSSATFDWSVIVVTVAYVLVVAFALWAGLAHQAGGTVRNV
jgi:hypothetical protein